MICPKCGKEIPEQAKFCMYCGTRCSEETTKSASKTELTPADCARRKWEKREQERCREKKKKHRQQEKKTIPVRPAVKRKPTEETPAAEQALPEIRIEELPVPEQALQEIRMEELPVPEQAPQKIRAEELSVPEPEETAVRREDIADPIAGVIQSLVAQLSADSVPEETAEVPQDEAPAEDSADEPETAAEETAEEPQDEIPVEDSAGEPETVAEEAAEEPRDETPAEDSADEPRPEAKPAKEERAPLQGTMRINVEEALAAMPQEETTDFPDIRIPEIYARAKYMSHDSQKWAQQAAQDAENDWEDFELSEEDWDDEELRTHPRLTVIVCLLLALCVGMALYAVVTSDLIEPILSANSPISWLAAGVAALL